MVLNSRLKWVAVLSVGVFATGCCRQDESPVAGATDDPKPQNRVLAPEDPEPAGTGFKQLKSSCTEPVVRLDLAAPGLRPDAAGLVEVVREFVAANPEFASPTVNYAEVSQSGSTPLLARCPDPDTANRLARKIATRQRAIRAVPVCGYATSGWSVAQRALQFP